MCVILLNSSRDKIFWLRQRRLLLAKKRTKRKRKVLQLKRRLKEGSDRDEIQLETMKTTITKKEAKDLFYASKM
jgi:hypothetical protein